MDIVDRIRKILAGRHLNINQVSQLTHRLCGPSSAFFVPHNFYHNIELNGLSPHICQVYSLSKITNYSLVDWLAVFGFHLDEIPRLQIKLHSEWTILITPVTYDKEAMVPSFEAIDPTEPTELTIPLSRIVQSLQLMPVRSIESSNRRSFLYAKVGWHDAMVFPELVPGSIVRVDPQRTSVVPFLGSSTRRRPIYLVEHSRGLSCCYIDPSNDKHILLRPHSLPFESMEFRLSTEAVILGTVDAEIRPLKGIVAPEPSQSRRTVRTIAVSRRLDSSWSLRDLVRFSRERTGLQFRNASEMSSKIAEELGDQNYAISVGSLFDYETSNVIPRHIHKIISLCILHCIDFWHYLRAAGMLLQEAGKEHIPPENGIRARKNDRVRTAPGRPAANVSIGGLTERIEELPLFLYKSLKDLLNSQGLSLRDVYLFGRKQEVLHPLLQGAMLILVNRRAKRVSDRGWQQIWEKPLYLILTRDDKYVCGFCSYRDGILTVDMHSEINRPAKRFRYEQDAEVVGQVIGVVRLI